MQAVSARTKYLAVYAAAALLTQVVIALPGLPESDDPGASDVSMLPRLVLYELVLFFFLWRGSKIAWTVAVLLNGLALGFVFLVVTDGEPGVAGVFLLSVVRLFALAQLRRIERVRPDEPKLVLDQARAGGRSEPPSLRVV